MRQISVENVVPGMRTGRTIYPISDPGGLPLLAANVVITQSIRDRLIRSEIEVIMISDELSEGIEPATAITDETRRTAVTTLKSTYDSIQSNDNVFSPDQLKRVESTMKAILDEILRKRAFLVCLNDLTMFGGSRLQHAVNVCITGCNIARHYVGEHGWKDFRGERRSDGVPDRLHKLGVGLLLADIGMLSVPQEIVDRQGVLSAEERQVLQSHPQFGIEMADGADMSPLSRIAIAQHHERYDGSGYPRGIAGDQIHDHGAIAGIAEAYVSLCDTPQGDGDVFQPHEAWKLILKSAGRLFSEDVVRSFAATVAPFAAGTSVKLSDGTFGIIMSNNDDVLKPNIRITHDRDGSLFSPPRAEINLGELPRVWIVSAVSSLPTDGFISVHN